MRKDASIQIDNPAGKVAITNETYVQKKIRENLRFWKNRKEEKKILKKK